MAKSRFEYVRTFELPDPLLNNTFVVCRVDGRTFHKFSDVHDFEKPNDKPALDLMDRAARAVMDELPDVVMAFGESDEYSFLIRRQSHLFNRRRSKINSTVVSIFTSAYVFYWPQYMTATPMQYPPSFDGRVVLYPTEKEVRDYFSWRQADTHINNLYNTAYHALLKGGQNPGTDSKDKNELLFTQFGINYNNISPQFRKGSTLVRVSPEGEGMAESVTPHGEAGPSIPRRAPAFPAREVVAEAHGDGVQGVPDDPGSGVEAEAEAVPGAPVGDAEVEPKAGVEKKLGWREKKARRTRPYEGITGRVVVLHEDIIGDKFWSLRPWLLS